MLAKFSQMGVSFSAQASPSSSAASAAAAAATTATSSSSSKPVSPSSLFQQLNGVTVDDDDDGDEPEDVDDDDDGDGDDDEDEDGSEDISGALAEFSVFTATADPVFQAALRYLLQQCGQIMERMNTGQEVPVAPTATTRHALAKFIYEQLWLPAKGDFDDEAEESKWL